MHCVNCNNSLSPEDKFCSGCGRPVPQVKNCTGCGAKLSAGVKFCSSCGTPSIIPSTTFSAQPKTERLCGTSGKPIREHDECFRCKDCEEFHFEQYRFQDGIAICKTCAHQDGSAEAYELEQQRKAKEEAEKLLEIKRQLGREYQARLKQEQEAIEQKLREQAEQERKATEAKLAAEAKKREQAERERLAKEQEFAQMRAAQQQAEEDARKAAEAAKSKQKALPICDDDFVSIPEGRFTMGSPEHEFLRLWDDERQHTVYVAGFELMKTPVTFAQYKQYCQKVGKEVPNDSGWGRGQRPVMNVSYWDAVKFCEWLSEQAGKTYRLPTEAEWEYACRAGTGTAYWYGDNADTSMIHCDGSRTLPVGSFQANPWGLFDMLGNVHEWCASEYDGEYSGKEEQDASGDRANKKTRVYRGGCWIAGAAFIRSACRSYGDPGIRSDTIGFRIARAI